MPGQVSLGPLHQSFIAADLDDLLEQSLAGELKDPFREPMGIAHSGWGTRGRPQEEKAEVPVEEEGGEEVGVELSSRRP